MYFQPHHHQHLYNNPPQSVQFGVGTLYVALGVVGFVLNVTTVAMIVLRRVYRLSAYTIMANVAVADALMVLVGGVTCGARIMLDARRHAMAGGQAQFTAEATLPTLPMAFNVGSKVPLPAPAADEEASSWFAPSAPGHQPRRRRPNYATTRSFFPVPYRLQSDHHDRRLILLDRRKRRNRRELRSRLRRFWQLRDQIVKQEKKRKEVGQRRTTLSGPIEGQILRHKPSAGKGRGFGQLRRRRRSANVGYDTDGEGGDIHRRYRLRSHDEDEEDGEHGRVIEPLAPSSSNDELLNWAVCFIEVAAWTCGVVSYAVLGINRCVAICFYGTRAKAFNRVSIALAAGALTWLIAVSVASMGTFPTPLVRIQTAMWSISFGVSREDNRSMAFVCVLLSVYTISVLLQWTCSTLVLLKIHQVKKKISRNKLNQNSAIRFRKQARLTFQFFYPSLFCTISSILYFAKPFCLHLLSDTHLIILHIIWLANHLCNPFIYAYFNERMRLSYYEFLTCARLRLAVARRRRHHAFFKNRGGVTQASKRSAHHQRAAHQMSVRSAGAASNKSNGTAATNFVRNSLQLQSRDFEQLCEFMMRVNPLYDSSEGWRETSSVDRSGVGAVNSDGWRRASDVIVMSGGGVVATAETTPPAYDERSVTPPPLGALELRARAQAIRSGAYNNSGGGGGNGCGGGKTTVANVAAAAVRAQLHHHHHYQQQQHQKPQQRDYEQHRSSIVADFGRQTVEHWAVFAKKTSI